MTPEEKTENSTQPVAVKTNTIGIKELLIPGSIAIAGLFVGAGLYFGGAPTVSNNEVLGNDIVTPSEAKTLIDLVEETGVSEKDFIACVDDGSASQTVQNHMNNAVETGGRGTPWSILIGPGGKKYPINGALPQQAVQQAIDLALAEASEGPDKTGGDQALNNVIPVSDSDHVRGNPDADVVIIEYSDFDCPFCTRFHETMKDVVADSDGRVAWVYRHFPLEQLHPQAAAVAVASECVADIGGDDAFWQFTDSYYSAS